MPKRKKTNIPIIKPEDFIEMSLMDLLDLIKMYNQASKDKKESFTFKNHEVLTAYAKYMIEYLRNYFDYQYEDTQEE